MGIDISIKIGGAAGQGIQTVGDLLAEVAIKSGLYVMAVNDFESRIRGGHSFLLMRIADKPVMTPDHRIHILVDLDEKTYELYRDQLADGGLAIRQDKAEGDDKVATVPIMDLAKEAGGKVMANVVAAGSILSLLGSPFERFLDVLEARFKSKSQEIVENNFKAAESGYNAVSEISFKWAFSWDQPVQKTILINGSKAVSLGALAADCRFAAFYPMSPATSVMTNLVPYTDTLPLVVEQAEDEIAAVNMIIGASYAGIRAITSTSGGGFSLMVEGLGFAGITETPIVIVNAQRPGPATGLPTRTEQADLLFTVRASQDEFPRFVFAPGTPEEAFETMKRAFDLSEKYQVPAIVLVDQYFCDSLFTAERNFEIPNRIQRHTVSDQEIESPGEYKRYAFDESGISPRALPCKGKALVMASGNEHTEDGHISEDADNRNRMVEKRHAKLPAMTDEMNAPQGLNDSAETLLVCWGSSRGAVWEAVEILNEQGMDVGALHLSDLWPFPAEKVKEKLQQAGRFIMVEGNSTAQLGLLIREQTGLLFSGSVLKYDGRPFYPIEIVEKVKTIKE